MESCIEESGVGSSGLSNNRLEQPSAPGAPLAYARVAPGRRKRLPRSLLNRTLASKKRIP